MVLSITDLPVDILLKIYSYLDHSTVCQIRDLGGQCNIACGAIRYFDFSEAYTLTSATLEELLIDCREDIVSLNINKCHWLSENAINLTMDLPNLKELHMIDCQFYHTIENLKVPIGLNALSFTWDSQFTSISDKNYLSQLFSSLKTLFVRFDYFKLNELWGHLLRHCSDLKFLKLQGIQCYMDDPYVVQTDLKLEHFCPKLENFDLDLLYLPGSEKYFCELLKNKPKFTLLNLGRFSALMLEDNKEIAEQLVAKISCDDLNEIYLQGKYDTNFVQACPIILRNKKYPKCTKITIKNVRFQALAKTAQAITESCPALLYIDLYNWRFDEQLLEGMKTLTSFYMDQLIHLNFTFEFEEYWPKPTRDCVRLLFGLIAKFKHLKALHLSSEMFELYHGLSSVANRVKQVLKRFKKETTFADDLKQSPLFEIGQSCAKMEEFVIGTPQRSMYVREEDLAVIGHWKNLKILRLCGIMMGEEGRQSIEYILRNCLKLETLHLDIDIDHRSEYFAFRKRLMKNLGNLTELRDFRFENYYYQEKLCSEHYMKLFKSLNKCKRLQSITLYGLKINRKKTEHFVQRLSSFPKLVSFKARETTLSRDDILSIKAELLKEREQFTLIINQFPYSKLLKKITTSSHS